MNEKLFHDHYLGLGRDQTWTPGSAVGLATDCTTGPVQTHVTDHFVIMIIYLLEIIL